jgi:hypothetical protein
VADSGLDMVPLHVRPEAAAQFLGSQSLTDGADIVTLTFNGEQRGSSDRGRIDELAALFELAQRQRMLLKHGAHSL